MPRISIPQYHIELLCDEFSASIPPLNRRIDSIRCISGVIEQPLSIDITLVFGELQPLLNKIAVRGSLINMMEVFRAEDLDPIVFRYVVINREEIIEDKHIVHMKALRCDSNEEEKTINKRRCSCGREIEYYFVHDSMLTEKGFNEKIFDVIWNSDLFEFKCCQCFKKKLNNGVLMEHTGRYITLTWGIEGINWLGDIDEE